VPSVVATTAAVVPTPAPTPPWPTADLRLTALNYAFVDANLKAKAGKPFTIAFQNLDAGVGHNIHLLKPDGSDAVADSFSGGYSGGYPYVDGIATLVYRVPSLKAGRYTFRCDLHAEMTGVITVN
jgi:plastocyanin